MKNYFHERAINTDQNNLLTLEPKLAPYLQEFDFFSILDLTEQSYDWVKASGITDGLLTVQSLHTTAVISINELDEPCLLGDINNILRDTVPKTKPYLHNSKIRTKNLCADDNKCDRNADAHMKSFLFGSPTQSTIIREAKPLWGRWQRICLIDFDGPRSREIAVQIIGE